MKGVDVECTDAHHAIRMLIEIFVIQIRLFCESKAIIFVLLYGFSLLGQNRFAFSEGNLPK